MPLLFVYQLNSFSTGRKYLLQRNSLLVAIKWGLYHVQMVSGSIVITKWIFLTIREIWWQIMLTLCEKLRKRDHRSLIFIKSYPISFERGINHSLGEKYQNTEFFRVRIFPHLDWIRRDTPHLSVFCPNAGKYGPEKTPYLDSFRALHSEMISASRVMRISVNALNLQKNDVFNIMTSSWWFPDQS